MKPFNLEKAIAGKPVVTRSGEKVTEFTYFNTAKSETWPIKAVIQGYIFSFTKEGKSAITSKENECDLFMASKKKSGWINIYSDNITTVVIFASEEVANTASNHDRIACVKVEWEE